MTNRNALTTILATALSLGAVAGTAAAQPFDAHTPVTHAAAPSERAITPSGFEWGDAAIGAGAALTLVLAAGGGTVVLQRSRRAHA